ncbi:unnamed protein product [Menidia menidia]|uniref:(Atlantic silverside) hypothetical protein n=1 Tax=Menidia menidia TaxID=238744 RepID=A0A8S4BJP4_9TELE|nr:unnamed protein product [Menidia menidia]
MAGWHRVTALSLGLLLLFCAWCSGRPAEKCLGGETCRSPRPPVVLIPGDLGNQLEAKLDKPSVVHYICYRKTDTFFTLWLNLELLIPVAIDCWIDNIRLIYNTTTHTSSSPPGVFVRVPGFGKTYSLEYLDPSKRSVGEWTSRGGGQSGGGQPGETARPADRTLCPLQACISSASCRRWWSGATPEMTTSEEPPTTGGKPPVSPHTPRPAAPPAGPSSPPLPSVSPADENKEYFLALQQMIEEMAEKAGGPVVLIAHSMGNMYTLYFLNQQPQAWKDKYIKAFVCLGAPWAGVAKTLRVVTSGDNNRIPVISSLKIRSQQRTAISTNWLLPYAHSWPKDQVLIQTPKANYTVQDYERLYSDIGFQDGWLMRQDTEPLVSELRPPGVEVHCLYGSGVPTAAAYSYSDKFPDVEPAVLYGNGDGTVNLQSAVQCKRWAGRQRPPVTLKELPGNEHVNMLTNFTTVAYIKTVLFSP